VLCSLFDLYKKTSKQTAVSLIDLQMLREFDYESEEKRSIEKSQIYIGYKILWIIRLFLDGKKFPQGNIREKKWRTYIHDVIQFLSTPEFLRVLLEIDAGSFFQVISILFYQSKPFELVLQGREDSPLKCRIHRDFLNDLNNFCLASSEMIKNQFLFFVASVVAKNPLIEGVETQFYYSIARELLAKHRRYLEFNKGLHEMSSKKRQRIKMRMSNSDDVFVTNTQVDDEVRYLQKTENDFINLLKLSEPLDNF